MESLKERAVCAEQGTRSIFWTDLLLPEMVQMCKTKGRQLITGHEDDDDVKRGWVQALEWVMNLPDTIIKDQAREETEQMAEEAATHEDEWRAEHGFRSPIRQAPEPGDLKVEENDG